MTTTAAVGVAVTGLADSESMLEVWWGIRNTAVDYAAQIIHEKM